MQISQHKIYTNIFFNKKIINFNKNEIDLRL